MGQPAAGQPLDNPTTQLSLPRVNQPDGEDRHLGCFHVATVRRAANIAHLELNLVRAKFRRMKNWYY